MMSTGCRLRYFSRKRTDGRTQKHLGSGIKKFPLTNSASLCHGVFEPAFIGLTSPLSDPVFPVSFLEYVFPDDFRLRRDVVCQGAIFCNQLRIGGGINDRLPSFGRKIL